MVSEVVLKFASQTVRLVGEHFGKRAPATACGAVLRDLGVAVRQSVLMAFVRRSTIVGRAPKWLARAADLRFVGISGDDETVLHLEMPSVGEAAEELFRQQEL